MTMTNSQNGQKIDNQSQNVFLILKIFQNLDTIRVLIKLKCTFCALSVSFCAIVFLCYVFFEINLIDRPL